jgi:hypothetical protein
MGSNMNSEDQQKYNRIRKAGNRCQETTPKAKSVVDSRDNKGRGRPPLSPDGPMTPEQLVEKRKVCVRKRRLSEKRRKAVSHRSDRQPVSGMEEEKGWRTQRHTWMSKLVLKRQEKIQEVKNRKKNRRCWVPENLKPCPGVHGFLQPDLGARVQ